MPINKSITFNSIDSVLSLSKKYITNKDNTKMKIKWNPIQVPVILNIITNHHRKPNHFSYHRKVLYNTDVNIDITEW